MHHSVCYKATIEALYSSFMPDSLTTLTKVFTSVLHHRYVWLRNLHLTHNGEERIGKQMRDKSRDDEAVCG